MGFAQDSLIRAAVASNPGPGDDFWYKPVGAGNVNTVTVMSIPMVYACVRVLAETVAQVPLNVFEDLGIDGKRRASEHPLQFLLHSQPNNWQTSFEWREMMEGQAVLGGNAYSFLKPGRRGPVDEIIPLNPQRMAKITREPDGSLAYHYSDPKNGMLTFPQERIFHLRGLSNDGIMGLSVVDIARSTFQLNLSLTHHAEKFFKNAARPGGVIEHPSKFKDTVQKEQFKQDWREFATGKIGDVAVLEHGMSWTQLGMTQEDAQFLQTFQQLDVNLARLFRMQLHMVQDLRKATFSNIEQQSLEFVVYTMTPWFVRWEQAMNRDLLTSPRFFTKFNMNGLLRGATKDRFIAYKTAIMSGFMTRQEVRILEDLNPEPQIGELFVPLNMAPEGEVTENEPSERAQAILLSASKREVRREVRSLRSALKAVERTGVFDFSAVYEDQAERIADNLAVNVRMAEQFVALSLQKLAAAANIEAARALVAEWEKSKAEQMARYFAYVKQDAEEAEDDEV